MADAISGSARSFPPVFGPAMVLLGLLFAVTLALWAHYGTAVFYEMILAGVAACF
jgi:hypothetical protein